VGSVEREVISSKISLHVKKPLNSESFELTALLEPNGWGKTESADRTSGPDTSGEHVLASRVNVGVGEGVQVHVGWLLGVNAVSSMTSGDDRIEELGKDFVGLLVASDASNCLDVWMSRVVNSGLDDVSERSSRQGATIPQGRVHLWGKSLRHEVVVFAQIWHRLGGDAIGCESGSLLGAVVASIATTDLDPLGKGGNSG
jgi:hypothetical protein